MRLGLEAALSWGPGWPGAALGSARLDLAVAGRLTGLVLDVARVRS